METAVLPTDAAEQTADVGLFPGRAQDPFWQLIGPLLQSEFPPKEIERVMGFIKWKP